MVLVFLGQFFLAFFQQKNRHVHAIHQTKSDELFLGIISFLHKKATCAVRNDFSFSSVEISKNHISKVVTFSGVYITLFFCKNRVGFNKSKIMCIHLHTCMIKSRLFAWWSLQKVVEFSLQFPILDVLPVVSVCQWFAQNTHPWVVESFGRHAAVLLRPMASTAHSTLVWELEAEKEIDETEP